MAAACFVGGEADVVLAVGADRNEVGEEGAEAALTPRRLLIPPDAKPMAGSEDVRLIVSDS